MFQWVKTMIFYKWNCATFTLKTLWPIIWISGCIEISSSIIIKYLVFVEIFGMYNDEFECELFIKKCLWKMLHRWIMTVHINPHFNLEKIWDLVKLVMCTLVSRVHMTFCILTKGHTVPKNRGTHDKLNQIQIFYSLIYT